MIKLSNDFLYSQFKLINKFQFVEKLPNKNYTTKKQKNQV